MVVVFATLALAADKTDPVVVGGGIDAAAGLRFPERGVVDEVGGFPQIEGDLGFRAGSLSGRADLDLSVWFAGGKLVPVTLVPEQLWLRVRGGDVYLAAGDVVSPWRRESVDTWDRALTSTSMLTLHAVPTSVAGGVLGWSGKDGGVQIVGGVDLGGGFDLLSPPSTWAPGAPLLAGVHGHLGKGNFGVGAGAFYRPEAKTGGVELDARFDAEVVVAEAQGLLGLRAPGGVSVSAELFPHLLVAPTARLEWYGDRPGGALGVAVRPVPFVRIAAEGVYSDGLPAAWVSADVFTPGTSRRAGKGGDVGDP